MKSGFLLFLCLVAVACAAAPAAFAQAGKPAGRTPPSFKPKFAVRPLKDAAARMAEIRTESSTSTTIPLWNYRVVSPIDGHTYSGMMVGRSPFFHGARTTTVTSYVVPVRLTFSDSGFVFDPTAPDGCINNDTVESLTANSPIFLNASFTMNGVNVGTTQYIDAFQRANFWTDLSATGNRYHALLSLTTLSVVSVTVPVANGVTEFGFCGYYGNMDINWWDNYVQTTLIPSLAGKGVNATNLPIFLFDSVVMYENGDPNQCCVLGYHSAYSSPVQTYSVIDFDTSATWSLDISVASHEVGEWMNDPLGTNPTPLWGNIGQVSGCQSNLEVGDPLSGTYFTPVTMPNGFTYNPQELAFFSWFYRQSPSIGSGGLFSNNDTFTTDAGPVCR
jgi:hypothetical protein